VNGIEANDPDWPRTNLFQACRGVFEGGGCRGAAHVGAFEAAITCGVNFSEVAGTSAGSIIAALVGAGADPKYLLRTCAHLKFQDFLSEPNRRIGTFAIAKLASHFFRGNLRIFGRILHDGSAYSSEKLQTWVDDRLAELLPGAERPVKFKELVLPTWIVATDLAGKRPMTWSTEDTPNVSVGLAVRSSCSIPLFFEPVELGNDLFVDGGMLSNLPSYVFADPRKNALALGGRILAFRLVGDDVARSPWRIDQLVKRLIDAAISGATAVQQSMQRDVTTVTIPTGRVSSTNFAIDEKDVNFLLDSGRRSVVELIRNEHQHVAAHLFADGARLGEDELFDDLVREMTIPGQRLAIACSDTKWFWSLFPSVIHWVCAGATVDILLEQRDFRKSELQRQETLRKLGARIMLVKSVPFLGYVLGRTDDSHNAAFVLSGSDAQYAPFGTVYVGPKHRSVVGSLLNGIDRAANWPSAAPVILQIRKSDPQKMIALLKRGVKQYGDEGVTMELTDVSLEQSKPMVNLLVRRIRSYKYRQIGFLAALYRRFGLVFCEPADIVIGGDFVSTVVPPVMEARGDALVSIEGNTRIYYLCRNGTRSVIALVVSGVTAPLPGRPVAPSKALLSTYELDISVRMQDGSIDNFRSIERAVRPTD
jgi:predicted acylesterase/phospholipase RssA